VAASALALSAYYHEVGDFIAVKTALVDSDSEPLDPSEVRGMSVTLMKRDTTIAEVSGLDKFYADADLWFNVRFNRPAECRGVTITVACTERGPAKDWARKVNVQIAVYDEAEGELGDNRTTVNQ
jgi:hypothetical protein